MSMMKEKSVNIEYVRLSRLLSNLSMTGLRVVVAVMVRKSGKEKVRKRKVKREEIEKDGAGEQREKKCKKRRNLLVSLTGRLPPRVMEGERNKECASLAG